MRVADVRRGCWEEVEVGKDLVNTNSEEAEYSGSGKRRQEARLGSG